MSIINTLGSQTDRLCAISSDVGIGKSAVFRPCESDRLMNSTREHQLSLGYRPHDSGVINGRLVSSPDRVCAILTD